MQLKYLVERNGVYSQGIYGVFDNLAEARDAATEAKAAEKDDYHTFCILVYIDELRGYKPEAVYLCHFRNELELEEL